MIQLTVTSRLSTFLWRISTIYVEKIDEKYNQHDQPDDFYTSNFMQKHTRFASFDEFCRQSPWKIHIWSELERVPGYKLDSYVNKTTTFDSWEEMQTQAALTHIFERHTV